HRSRRAVDDRSAFFPRDRGWHHDHTDGKIQYGGLDLSAFFRVGHGAGAPDRYSRRRSHGANKKRRQNLWHVGQYLRQRADLRAGAYFHVGPRHRGNHGGG